MINCNLKVVNAINDNNLYYVNYIPFSISTVKLLIQNNENFRVKIILKPARFQNDDEFNGGFDDDNKGLRIMWGGGEEMKRFARSYSATGGFLRSDYFPMPLVSWTTQTITATRIAMA